MDTSKVVMRLVVYGENIYMIGTQPSNLDFKKSENPFTDNEISKYTLEQAKELFPIIQSWHPIGVLQIVDNSGKVVDVVNNFHNVINEEIQTLVNEGYMMEHDNFKFRQEIKTSSFYNYQNFSNDFDVDINESNIIINWRIGFWLNDQGVENFIVQADSVEGMYHVELLNKQSDSVEQEMDKNIAEIPWKFQIYPIKLKTGDGLYVDYLDFDFETKICTVNFFETDTE